MDPAGLQEFKETLDRTGVVYMSRIPPGMTPYDIRTQLSPFGEVARLYLAPLKKKEDESVVQGKRKKRADAEKELSGRYKRRTVFVEGWVEFADKRAAKTAVAALNGAPIASSNPRQRDCMWCLKYLSGFKWVHLTEKLTLDRAYKDKKLKAERRMARRENEHYLVQVERAQSRARAAKKAGPDAPRQPAPDFDALRIRFKQRRPIE